jgi:putative transposase
VLAWRLTNTMDSSFCISALEEALARFGRPEIFNTDQGSQFTSAAFTGMLIAAGVRISMDGRGRWMDNVFIERLWRSLKHEDIYLKAMPTGARRTAGLRRGLPFTTTRHTAHLSMSLIQKEWTADILVLWGTTGVCEHARRGTWLLHVQESPV